MKKHMKKSILAIAVLGIAAALFTGPQQVKAEEGAKIADGVYIGRINVGGMTREQATATLENYVQSMEDEVFIFQAEGTSMELKGSQMDLEIDIDAAVDQAIGFASHGSLISRYIETKELARNTVTVPLPVSADWNNVAQYIILERDNLNVNVVDNKLKRTDGGFTIEYGTPGKQVKISDSVTNIHRFLEDEYVPGYNVIPLEMETIDPPHSAENLSRVNSLLGCFWTDYSNSSDNRKQNVENGVSKINGAVLYPGEEYSVYDAVKPFTEENGYELAGTYGNGRVVETFGGGICQVSTTLYNAVIRAELQVTERFNHTMQVGYVKPSCDAAISSGVKDLKFVNTLDAPVYIEGYCYDGQVYFNIYGEETRPSNRKVVYESETVSEDKYDTKFEMDSEMNVGTYTVANGGFIGCVAKLWRIVYIDDAEDSRDVFNTSYYDKVDRVIKVGTAGATSEQYNSLLNAIDSGDESSVIAVVNAISSGY